MPKFVNDVVELLEEEQKVVDRCLKLMNKKTCYNCGLFNSLGCPYASIDIQTDCNEWRSNTNEEI